MTTFGSLLSQIRLSSVTFVCPTQGVETFDNISSPLCMMAIIWSPCKILRRSFQGNPSVGAVKSKTGSKIERWWTYWKLYLMSRSGFSSLGEFLVFFYHLCRYGSPHGSSLVTRGFKIRKYEFWRFLQCVEIWHPHCTKVTVNRYTAS